MLCLINVIGIATGRLDEVIRPINTRSSMSNLPSSVLGNLDAVDSHVSFWSAAALYPDHRYDRDSRSLTSILISRLSLDLREVNSAYIDGGEVFTRTVLRDIPDFIHSESADSNHSEQLSSHHARAEVDSIDGKDSARLDIESAHRYACLLQRNRTRKKLCPFQLPPYKRCQCNENTVISTDV